MRVARKQGWKDEIEFYSTYGTSRERNIISFKGSKKPLIPSNRGYFLSYEEGYQSNDVIVHLLDKGSKPSKHIGSWQETNKEKFDRLKTEVKEETGPISTPDDIAMHPLYQRIIGMGQKALPYILEDLKQDIFHWFWALQAITGVNPIDEEDFGQMDKMADAWIKWGEERNIIH